MYYFFLVYKHTNDDVFADFPKIDEEEPKTDIFTRDDIRFYQFDTARGDTTNFYVINYCHILECLSLERNYSLHI